MIEQDYEQLTLFPADSPVNRSALPANSAARTMTVSSGRRCAELYAKSGRLGLLAKTCLESSIWHSTRCWLTWKALVTKRRRLLFQLAVSMPHTGGSGSLLWPTPKAAATMGGCSGARKTLDRMCKVGLITEEERKSFSAGNGGKTNPALLEWLMGYEQKFTEVMPTPTTRPMTEPTAKRFLGGGVLQEQSLRIVRIHTPWEKWTDEPAIPRVVDGIPDRLDRIKCLGNAVVPQQFYPFFKAIHDIEVGEIVCK